MGVCMDKYEKIKQAKTLLHELVVEDWKTSGDGHT